MVGAGSEARPSLKEQLQSKLQLPWVLRTRNGTERRRSLNSRTVIGCNPARYIEVRMIQYVERIKPELQLALTRESEVLLQRKIKADEPPTENHITAGIDDVLLDCLFKAWARQQRPEFVARDLRKCLRHGSEDGLYRATKSAGERLLRGLQFQATGRVPERRNLLLLEGNPGAGETVGSSLQHHPAALFAGLQTTGASGLRCKELGVWRNH